MKYICSHVTGKALLLLGGLLLSLGLLLTACDSTFVMPTPTNQTHAVSVDPDFQQGTPIATAPTYLCGAWSSNNAPGVLGTITIYARLTQNIAGIPGKVATATVHFHSGDVTLTQHPTSDSGGFVSFTLPLLGRQPGGIPATVDVSFSIEDETLDCASAFFTPQ